MSIAARPMFDVPTATATAEPVDHLWRRVLRSGRVVVGGSLLLAMVLLCVGTMWWTARAETRSSLYYDAQTLKPRLAPDTSRVAMWFGSDALGNSLLGRSLLGGAISLGIGVAAACISVILGVSVGLLAGYRGGWVDSLLMRLVDILYGLPYILMVVLLKVALEPLFGSYLHFSAEAANLTVLFLAIGLVSWLTMARVVRGQVLSLRAQPFIEACRASGLTEWRIFTRHLLPNLVGPITVYATLIIPQAILQESFLSFLGIGIQPPMPTWGSLAGEGLVPGLNPVTSYPWLLAIPCALLAVTLLSLNFVGDGLRDVFDPKRDAARI